MKTKKAFTLIELLVVIAIIGVLATISIIALSNARAKSRDAKRAGDMKQVQTALELFFNDKNRYPTAEEFALGSIFSTSTYGTSTYMQIIPSAPTPADGSCTPGENTIYYQQTENGNSYTISFCLGNTTGTLTAGSKCLTPAGIIDVNCSLGGGGAPVCDDMIEFCGFTTCGGSGTYGGQTYNTIEIGTQCWFKENLNIGDMVDSNYDQTNDSLLEKYCYNNNASSECDVYGGLYQWHEALRLPVSCTVPEVDCDAEPTSPCCNFTTPIQGICPSGWHIPSDTEFTTLEDYLGGVSVAGAKLKTSGSWDGDNSSGFTALAGGYLSRPWGGFLSAGTNAMFWSSSVAGAYSWSRYLSTGDFGVGRSDQRKPRGHSIRCIMD